MGRTKQFEFNDVLDCAMREFWRKGYSATSIPKLEVVMGIKRQSLYDTFKSKRGLFLQVLKYYHENIIVKNFAPISNSLTPKQAICEYFSLRAKEALTVSDIKGCLVTNSIAELSLHDEQVCEQTNKTLLYMRSTFRDALERAKRLNEISSDLDIDEAADFLVNYAQGLFVVSRMSVTKITPKGVVTQIENLLS